MNEGMPQCVLSYSPLDMLRDEDVVQVDVELGALLPEATLSRDVVRDEKESTFAGAARVRRLQSSLL